MPSKLTPESRPQTDEIAAEILNWLAGEPDILMRFLALSGITAEGLRAASRQPGFAEGLIEFTAAHEPTLLGFCAASGIAPQTVATAWQRICAPQADPD